MIKKIQLLAFVAIGCIMMACEEPTSSRTPSCTRLLLEPAGLWESVDQSNDKDRDFFCANTNYFGALHCKGVVDSLSFNSPKLLYSPEYQKIHLKRDTVIDGRRHFPAYGSDGGSNHHNPEPDYWLDNIFTRRYCPIQDPTKPFPLCEEGRARPWFVNTSNRDEYYDPGDFYEGDSNFQTEYDEYYKLIYEGDIFDGNRGMLVGDRWPTIQYDSIFFNIPNPQSLDREELALAWEVKDDTLYFSSRFWLDYKVKYRRIFPEQYPSYYKKNLERREAKYINDNICPSEKNENSPKG